jgi:hypothetical protein
MQAITRRLAVAVAVVLLGAGGCDVAPEGSEGIGDGTSNPGIEQMSQAWSRTSAGNMMYLAKGALCGQKMWGPGVNGHAFASHPATVNVYDGRTEFVAGQLSHILNWRPDDQIYYTIPYEGGMPKKPEITISRGGVASWFKIIADSIKLLGIDEVEIPGIGKKKINPEKAAEIATGISHLVEGRGWEAQAAAVINLIGLYAQVPGMICSMSNF